MDATEIAGLVAGGRHWEAAAAIAGLSDPELRAVAERVAEEAGDSADVMPVVEGLVAPGAPPEALDRREALVRAEAMRRLAAEVALAAVDEDWEDLLWAVRPLAADLSYRVREALIPVISKVASQYFAQSRGYWAESLGEESGGLAGLILRGLAASDAPVAGVLELFSTVMADIRADVRHNLGPRAIPALGRRDPKAVFMRMREWAAMPNEITRWNVAKALATPLGGAYVEEAVEILEVLAADERAAVWRAAAEAVVEAAQRRPALVIPMLARWRGERARMRCAELAIQILSKR